MTKNKKTQKPISKTLVCSFRIDKDLIQNTSIINDIKKLIFLTKKSYK